VQPLNDTVLEFKFYTASKESLSLSLGRVMKVEYNQCLETV